MSVPPTTLGGVALLDTAHAATRLLKSSGAWSLLRADNAPVVVAILSAHFTGTVRRLPAPVLFELVDQDLMELRGHGFDLPKAGAAYCKDWLDAGFLTRRPGAGREETFELTDGALTAIRFVTELTDPPPAATASRLETIVQQVHALALETDPDVERRIAVLEERAAAIQEQITQLRAGRIPAMAPERAAEQAADILALAAQIPEDFARVRAAFERINRELRTQLLNEPTSRGAVLDDVFRGVDLLADSDAGRTFTAFYELVLDAERTARVEAEVEELVQRDFAQDLDRAQVHRLRRLLPDMQDAGSEIHQVMTSFSRSLRRFVQTEELAEDRRVQRLIQGALKDATEVAAVMQPYHVTEQILQLTSVSITPLTGLRLLNPADDETVTDVESATAPPVDLAALRAAVRATEIDMAELRGNVNMLVARRGAVTAAEVLDEFPATQAVASVVGLLVLGEDHGIRTGRTERVAWEAGAGRHSALVPQYLFEEEIA